MLASYLARGAAIGIVVMLLAACPRGITDSSYSLTLSPTTAQLFVQDSSRFSASLVDHSGAPVVAPLSWSTDNRAVATVDSMGLVRAVGGGTATLRVSAKGESATAALVVRVDSGQSLSVAPNTASMFVSGTQLFTATLRDRLGNVISTDPEWTSTNPSVATVDSAGLVTAIATGSATIEARDNGLKGSAGLTVRPRPASVTFVGAGDIASCTSNADSTTGRMLDAISGTIFAAGDNAYPNGSAADYANCYAPAWGRHKARTRPVPGNHEYDTPNAAGYFGYWGAAAGDPAKGYYSYDLGGWHIVALNSNIAHNAGSPQEQWLRADLASSSLRCTLAYWHHPRFNSGAEHGDDISMQPLWQALYEFGADVVISAHEHVYERFAPQTPAGQLDQAKGIREFIVGTGGAALYQFGAPKPNSEVRYNASRGLLKLNLAADHYDWQFLPTATSFKDSGTAACH
ncbi:MAG: Ig-like domain-containing protein [Gemmatimonadales bacterium]